MKNKNKYKNKTRQISFYSLFIVFFIVYFLILLNQAHSIPLADISSKIHYRHTFISWRNYNTLPNFEKDTFVITKKTIRGIRVLIPVSLFKKYKQQKTIRRAIKSPKSFSQIDYLYKKRLQRKCPSAQDMLNGYKSNAHNIKYLQCLANEYKDIAKLFVIGKTRQSRKIYAMQIRQSFTSSSSQPEPFFIKGSKSKLKAQEPMQGPRISFEPRDSVFFNCGIHGNELIAIEHCYEILAGILATPKKYPSLEKLDVWVVPIVNPDGVHSFWFRNIHSGRKNGYPNKARNGIYDGVDLNRNFPFVWGSKQKKASSGKKRSYHYRGPSAASEPETRALISLMKKKHFLLSFSYHCYANSLLVPYSIEGLKNNEPHIANIFAQTLIKNIKSEREDKPFVIKKNLYAVDGTDMDYMHHEFGTLAFIVESSHLLQKYDDVPVILAGLRPLWENMLSAYSAFYKVRLLVTDPNGKPLVAKVEFAEPKTFEGETRYTRTDGAFSMFVAPENYDQKSIRLTISKKNYKTKHLKVRAYKNELRENVVLRELSKN